MKHIAITLALSLACTNAVQADNNSPELEIIKTENQHWQFRQISLKDTGTDCILSGYLETYMRYNPPHGHIDVAVRSAENKIIANTTTTYRPRPLSRRKSRKRSVRFSAKLPTLPANARIQIAFHRDSSTEQPQSPGHNTILVR